MDPAERGGHEEQFLADEQMVTIGFVRMGTSSRAADAPIQF